MWSRSTFRCVTYGIKTLILKCENCVTVRVTSSNYKSVQHNFETMSNRPNIYITTINLFHMKTQKCKVKEKQILYYYSTVALNISMNERFKLTPRTHFLGSGVI